MLVISRRRESRKVWSESKLSGIAGCGHFVKTRRLKKEIPPEKGEETGIAMDNMKPSGSCPEKIEVVAVVVVVVVVVVAVAVAVVGG